MPREIADMVAGLPPSDIDIGYSGNRIVCYGERFVLKRFASVGDFERERDAHLWLAGRLPVPQVVTAVVRDGYGWLLTIALNGVMSHLPPFGVCDIDVTIELLAEGLGLLAAVDIDDCPFDRRLDMRLAMARERVERGCVSTEHWEVSTDFDSPTALLQWLEDNRPGEELCFTHGDYCMPNIFFCDTPYVHIAGFVDLGLCGIADRWCDIALCARTMGYNHLDGGEGRFEHTRYGENFDRLLQRIGVRRDEEKLRYYILLDELL